ncbi:protein of unknown function (plasmid) [Cupriavidus taiwanensis]|uniref:Endonuclease n=1 Tax=Cupriavidus taiwanensis TaxID=164546 RepID=A0A375HCA2_9BURK|nr:hypothetical protein CBM2614_U10062 [Cupriavidus taiwanensis]SOZ75159.1 hypothetical protein CBM2613_U10061 [Cupriavidus taiwanensis]SPA03732.1 protein of unknown function [Cupriavidus taiwanensis]SPA11636.1 protein of unknown function [Cupriavidus taiwanensis]SPA57539.1 protein of unknown function [Cupriavidus taiwanensis]
MRKVGTAYVVTGPAFIRDAGTLRGRIQIPDFVWKAIYVPGMGAAAYIARNDATPAYSVASIAELAHFVGVDPFPSLPAPMRMTALDLPPPTPHPGEREPGRSHSRGWSAPSLPQLCRRQIRCTSLLARRAPCWRSRRLTHDSLSTPAREASVRWAGMQGTIRNSTPP